MYLHGKGLFLKNANNRRFFRWQNLDVQIAEANIIANPPCCVCRQYLFVPERGFNAYSLGHIVSNQQDLQTDLAAPNGPLVDISSHFRANV